MAIDAVEVIDAATRLREKHGPQAPLVLLVPVELAEEEVRALLACGISVTVCRWLRERAYLTVKSFGSDLLPTLQIKA